MLIDKPGIYRNIDVAAYHADCCPEPSFSQSIGKILIDQSPLHAKAAHPRLTTPDLTGDEIEKYVKAQIIGDAAHALMIGRGKKLTVAKDYTSWRTGEARDFRDHEFASGRIPILPDHFNQAHTIVRAACAQLDQHQEFDCFKGGAGEVALIWQEGPLWFRCLVDYLHDDLLTVDDYKTTEMSVAPHILGLRAADAGWDIQAAMIERGLNVLDPGRARRFRFIAQEQDAPHALNVMVMTPPWMIMGQKRLQYAIDRWAECVALKNWPGYPRHAIKPEYPGFKESQWLAREIADAAEDRMPARPMLTSIAGG